MKSTPAGYMPYFRKTFPSSFLKNIPVLRVDPWGGTWEPGKVRHALAEHICRAGSPQLRLKPVLTAHLLHKMSGLRSLGRGEC